jgi:hypothetical protein
LAQSKQLTSLHSSQNITHSRSTGHFAEDVILLRTIEMNEVSNDMTTGDSDIASCSVYSNGQIQNGRRPGRVLKLKKINRRHQNTSSTFKIPVSRFSQHLKSAVSLSFSFLFLSCKLATYCLCGVCCHFCVLDVALVTCFWTFRRIAVVVCQSRHSCMRAAIIDKMRMLRLLHAAAMTTLATMSCASLPLLVLLVFVSTTLRTLCNAFVPLEVTKATVLLRFHQGSWQRTVLVPFGDQELVAVERRHNKASSSSSLMMIMIEYEDFLPQPSPLLNSTSVVNACMDTMLQHKAQGLEVCFHFSSDNCRAALGGSLDRFSQYAENPIFGYLVHCVAYDIVSVGPLIQGTATRGAMQTVLLDAHQQLPHEPQQQALPAPASASETTTTPPLGREAKRFLWTLQQERRPPRQGCWLIREVIYVKNAYMLT